MCRFGDLRTIEDSEALFETVAGETLALDDSIGGNSALTAVVAAGAELMEVGDLPTRIGARPCSSRT